MRPDKHHPIRWALSVLLVRRKLTIFFFLHKVYYIDIWCICMKILIDLEENLVKKIEQLAKDDKRKRKQMIEILLEKAIQT